MTNAMVHLHLPNGQYSIGKMDVYHIEDGIEYGWVQAGSRQIIVSRFANSETWHGWL